MKKLLLSLVLILTSFAYLQAQTVQVLSGTTTITTGAQDNTLTLASSDVGYNYFLRNNADNSVIGTSQAGTGGSLTFQTGSISATTSYYVFAAKSSYALLFDGVDDQLIAPHDAATTFTSGFTIDTWINPTDITTNRYYDLYRKNNTNGGRVLLGFQEFGTVLAFGFQTDDDGYVELDITITPASYINQWMHILAYFDDATNTAKVYRDGVEIGSATRNGAVTAPTIPDHGYIGGTEEYKGKVASFRLWDKGLTTSEERAYAKNNLLKSNESNLIVYYPFYENTGTTVDDVTTTNNNAAFGIGIKQPTWTTGTTGGYGITASNVQTITFPTNTWTGTTDNDWDTATNWNPSSVPTVSADVYIPASLTNYPTASSATTVTSVLIGSGASLIAQSTFSGTITYKRSLSTTNWYLVGSPVVGETIEDLISNHTFATGTGSNIGLAPFLNDGTNWSYQTTASTGSLTSGTGYSVKLNASGDLSFTGTMPVDDVGISISSNTNAFNLVSNPFPSSLAANTNAHATNNLLTVNTANLTENTLWLWDQSDSSYDQINLASAATHIAPAQGFFVSSDGSKTFNFTEVMQSHQSTDFFQKNSSTRPEIVVRLTDGSKMRDTDIYYIDGTTTGFDNGYDSSIFGGIVNSFGIYTHAVANGSGRKLGIQSVPNTNLETMTIPVGINAVSGTKITISALAKNLPTGLNVYLEDKDDNSFTLLNDTSDFTSTLTSNLTGIGRFYIHTLSSVLNTNDFNLENVSVYLSSRNNLRVVGIQSGNAKIQLYDILGKQVFSSSPFQGNSVNDIPISNLKSGIYIIKLKTETGQLNKKISIQ